MNAWEKRDFRGGTKSLLATLIAAALGLLAARGQAINLTPTANNLYNTGYSGTVLAGNNQADTHYQLVGYGNGVAYQANPLANNWAPNPGDAQWITITAITTTGPSIIYDYRLNLSNIPAGRVVTIGGRVAADDNVTIVGNGSTAFFSNSSPGVVTGHYSGFTTFSSTTFVSGTDNYIDFLVDNNGGGPTGLNLELFGFYVALTSTAGLDIQIQIPHLDTNQQSVLNYINGINAIGVNNACFTNLTFALLALDNSDFAAAMDQLSPEKLAIFSSIAFNNASFMTQDLDDYLAHRRNRAGYFQANPGGIDTSGLTISDPTIDSHLSQVYSRLLAWSPATPARGLLSDVADPLLVENSPGGVSPASVDRWNVFIQGDVILGQNYSQQDLDNRATTTSSFGVGADYQFSKNFLMGVLFDYSHTDAELDNSGSSATVDSYAPGIYASYAQDGWYANALANYSHNAYTEQRVINIPSFNETANGAPEGDQETGDLDGGYDFHAKQWTFGPTVGAQYTHLNVDSFAETGGCSADLAVNRQDAESLRTRLGGHVSYEEKSGGLLLTPFLDASWQHECLDRSRGITSSFNDIGLGQFTVYTPDPGRESALLSTGLNIDINRMTTVFANYQVQVDPTNYFGQSILAGLKLAF